MGARILIFESQIVTSGSPPADSMPGGRAWEFMPSVACAE